MIHPTVVRALTVTALTAWLPLSWASAAVSVTVERASIVETTTTGIVTVYGGMAGSADRCDVPNSTTQTCNNCLLKQGEDATIPLGAPDNLLLPCNEHRINPNLELLVTIQSDAVDGLPTITSSDGQTAINVLSGQNQTLKGSSATLVIRWGAICDKVFSADASSGGGTGCISVNGFAAASLRVGFSVSGNTQLNGTGDDVKNINFVIRNSAGNPGETVPSLAETCDNAGSESMICYFDTGPGDEKAIVRTLLAPSESSFPSAENTQFKFVRFLFAENGFDHIHLASSYRDLPISSSDTSSFSVSPRRIEGLTNDKTYYVKSAVVDAAGNVGYYSSAAMDTDCSASENPAATDCKVVTPSEVVGVLDKTNCFIATAAYGSPMARELDTLRDFRDQILERSPLGHKFVRWYYEKSPHYARMILESPVARATVRTALVPVVWFAGMVLAYGPGKAGLAFLVSLIACAAVLSLVRRREFREVIRENYSKAKDRTRRSSLPAILAFLMVPPAIGITSLDSATAQDVQSLEDETPPEPEYPYPGARGAVVPTPESEIDTTDDLFSSTSESEPASPPVSIRPSQRHKPKAVNDEGDYIYESLPDVKPTQHGAPKAKKFSNLPGREKPATITAEGEFTYPVSESEFSGAAGIRFGMMNAPSIRNGSNNLTFKDIYGVDDVPSLLFEYEYPFTRSLGRIGLKFESGIATKAAPGRFKNPTRINELPEERFTFLMIPLQALLHYRFQFADAQWIVPFVEGGGGYNAIIELRDDGKSPRLAGAPALIAGGGVNILLDWIDRHAIRQLDSDYGINHVWFTAQYRQIVGLKSDLDISAHLISGGFTFDF